MVVCQCKNAGLLSCAGKGDPGIWLERPLLDTSLQSSSLQQILLRTPGSPFFLEHPLFLPSEPNSFALAWDPLWPNAPEDGLTPGRLPATRAPRNAHLPCLRKARPRSTSSCRLDSRRPSSGWLGGGCHCEMGAHDLPKPANDSAQMEAGELKGGFPSS